VSHDAKRQPAQTCALEGIGGSRPPGRCAYSRPPRRHAALPCFGVPSWTSRSVRHARVDMGTLLAFARRPPLLVATWRARYGCRPGSARRVPKTPRRPPAVGDQRRRENRITMARDATAESFAVRPGQPPASANAVATWREFPPPARFQILSPPAMEFSLRCAPPSRPSAFPLARSNQAHRSAASVVAGRAAKGQRAECALITGQGSPDRVRTGAWPHVPIHV
jgi:hypothetical protein